MVCTVTPAGIPPSAAYIGFLQVFTENSFYRNWQIKPRWFSLLGTEPIRTNTVKCTSILHVRMFVPVTNYTLRKIMSANDRGIVAVTGRAHCQRQVAFFLFFPPTCRIYFLWPVLFSSENSHFYCKFVIFSFFIFSSSDISWARNFIFIFFPPTCKKDPCRNPSSIEYSASCLMDSLSIHSYLTNGFRELIS